MKTNRLEVVKKKQTNKLKELKGGTTPPENYATRELKS